MNLKNTENEIKSIQGQAEQRLGFPLASEFWDEIDDYIGYTSEDYDGDPKGAQEYISEYAEVTDGRIRGIEIVLPSLKKQFEKELGIKTNPSADRNSKAVKPQKIYRGPFEHRLHLLDFILHKKGGLTARANWKRMAAEWNEEHPYYQKTHKALKAEYYKIIKDDAVTQSWIAWRVAPGMVKALRQIQQNLEQMPDVLQRATQRIMQMFAEHPEAKNLNDLCDIEASELRENETQSERTP